jgi:hypothetical protein
VNSVLLDFVRAALARGLSRPEIARVLREAGWQEADIGRALDALEFPLPVPKPQPYSSAREVVTYLVLFAALYVSALNLASRWRSYSSTTISRVPSKTIPSVPRLIRSFEFGTQVQECPGRRPLFCPFSLNGSLASSVTPGAIPHDASDESR